MYQALTYFLNINIISFMKPPITLLLFLQKRTLSQSVRILFLYNYYCSYIIFLSITGAHYERLENRDHVLFILEFSTTNTELHVYRIKLQSMCASLEEKEEANL